MQANIYNWEMLRGYSATFLAKVKDAREVGTKTIVLNGQEG